MAFFHARRTLASSLLRALSSASSISSVASRSPLAFATLTKQTPVIPLSLKFPIRLQTSVADESPVDDSSKDSTKTTPEDTDSTETTPTDTDSTETTRKDTDFAETTPKDTDSAETTPKDKDSAETKKKEVVLAGCDLKHWLIMMEFPTPNPSEEEMLNTYVKTLAEVVGSEEEAKKKIYSVSFITYTGFGAMISEELSIKVKGLPNVSWVLPDSYMDVPNKDYGGDLFIDGKVIPRKKYRRPPQNNNPEEQDDKGNEKRRPSQSQRSNRNRSKRE